MTVPPSTSSHRISVALCTYNGGRYLDAQLDSILGQTRPPAELVVCDDRSTDDTLAILDRFRQRAPFAVRIERNPETLGSTKNFEKAIGLCSGDLIATCDQDDVWFPEKLLLNEAAIDADPGPGLVFSDAEVVDEALCPLGHTMWESIEFGWIDRWRVRHGKAFEVLLRRWLVTGATMMFRADFVPLLFPIPPNWIHDGWIAFIIGAMAPIGLIDRPLVRYRQHAAQQIGGKKLSWRELYQKAREIGPPHYRLAYERFVLARERLQAMAAEVRKPGFASNVSMMDGKVAHQKRRLDIAESASRLARVAWTLDELARGRYTRYSPNSRHFIKDMLF
jgi:glycosyltransferase involved in cell wall biosynthesis